MVRIEWNIFLFLPRDGWLIDIGCRGFVLPKIATERGMKVISVDPAPDVSQPDNPNIFHEQLAIVSCSELESVGFTITGDKATDRSCVMESNRVVGNEANKQLLEQEGVIQVATITLEDLLHKYQLDQVEIIKLNCEGAEESILLNLKKPLARQISVEFHRHLGFSGFTDEIRDHMAKWYNWTSSLEVYPYQRTVFYLRGDLELYIFALLAKTQIIFSIPFYLARILVPERIRNNYILRGTLAFVRHPKEIPRSIKIQLSRIFE